MTESEEIELRGVCMIVLFKNFRVGFGNREWAQCELSFSVDHSYTYRSTVCEPYVFCRGNFI